MMCKECGYVAKCSDCDVSLVYHKEDETLKCHYCGKRYKALTCCPECKSTYIKQGAIGTERIVAELKKYYPDVKILRMDNDTTSTKDSYAKILSEFSSVKPSILVGTQKVTISQMSLLLELLMPTKAFITVILGVLKRLLI